MADIHFCECAVCEGAGTLLDIARGRGCHVTCDACDGTGEVAFVPIARVLEIVDAMINGWGVAIASAEKYGVGDGWVENDRNYKAAGEAILNRLQEEFEPE